MTHWQENPNLNPDSKDLVSRGAGPPSGTVYSYRSEVYHEPRSQLLEYWEALRRKLVMVGLLAE
jgi:hypothetical protein